MRETVELMFGLTSQGELISKIDKRAIVRVKDCVKLDYALTLLIANGQENQQNKNVDIEKIDKKRIGQLVGFFKGLNEELKDQEIDEFIKNYIECPEDQRLTSMDLLDLDFLKTSI